MRFKGSFLFAVMVMLLMLPLTGKADDYGTIDFLKLGIAPDATDIVDNILQVTRYDGDDEVQCWGSYPWSPDGEWIVYTSYRDNKEICIMRYDGSDWQQLTDNDTCDSHGSFTPDGRHIVFQRDMGAADIWIMDIDGSNQFSLSQAHAAEGPISEGDCENKPMVSPDGRKIAFHTCDEEIWVMNLDGTNPVKVSGDYDYCTKHSWSPDSRWVLFSAQVDYPVNSSSRIFIVRPDGSDLTMLSEDVDQEVCENWATWSPNGKYIAYHRREDIGPTTSYYSLCIMSPNGTDKEELVSEYYDWGIWNGYTICGPTSWSPDSRFIQYKKYSIVDGTRSIFIYSLNDDESVRITESYYDYRAWFSPSKDPYRILFRDKGGSRDDDGNNDLLVINSVKDGDDLSYDEAIEQLYGDIPASQITKEEDDKILGFECFITSAASQGNMLPLLAAVFGMGIAVIRKRLYR